MELGTSLEVSRLVSQGSTLGHSVGVLRIELCLSCSKVDWYITSPALWSSPVWRYPWLKLMGLASSWQMLWADLIDYLQTDLLKEASTVGWFCERLVGIASILIYLTRSSTPCQQWYLIFLVSAEHELKYFSPCTIATVIYNSIGDTTPPAVDIYATVVVLSSFRSTVMLDFPLVKVWMANVAARASRQLMWRVCT